jgi:membrane associated rhomboid family serine protease
MKGLRIGQLLLPPITATMLVTLFAAFVLAGFVTNFVPALATVMHLLPLDTSAVVRGEVWRLLTYAWVHDLSSSFHLIFNALTIAFFGRELELRFGTTRMLLFLLLSVLLGGLFVVGAGLTGLGTGRAIGSSSFSSALWVAWGLTFRDRPFLMFFALPMKGIHAVWLALAFWLLDAVSTSPVSAAAHLGGIVAAFFFVRVLLRPNAWRLFWAGVMQRVGRKKKPRLFVVPGPKNGPGGKWVN